MEIQLYKKKKKKKCTELDTSTLRAYKKCTRSCEDKMHFPVFPFFSALFLFFISDGNDHFLTTAPTLQSQTKPHQKLKHTHTRTQLYIHVLQPFPSSSTNLTTKLTSCLHYPHLHAFNPLRDFRQIIAARRRVSVRILLERFGPCLQRRNRRSRIKLFQVAPRAISITQPREEEITKKKRNKRKRKMS